MYKLTIVVLLMVLSGFASNEPAQNSALRVDELLSSVRRVYESAKTYTDVANATRLQGRVTLAACQVRTDFIRSQSIRIESKCDRVMYQDHHVALHDRGVTRFAEITRDGTKIKEESTSIDNVLPALSVNSLGYGTTITKLLTPEVKVNPMLPLTNPELRVEEAIGKIPVHVVSGMWRGSKVLLRIDKSTLLILQMEIINDFGTFEQKTTYTIEPKLNQEIPEDRFQIKALITATGSNK